VGNSSRRSRRRIRARFGAPHGVGGSGSRRQGGRARAEGERKGEGARRDPYHPKVLRRQLAVGDWWRQGEIVAALSSVERRHGDARARGKLGKAVTAEGERERAAGAKKRWGGLGVRVIRATAPAPPVDALRLDPIRALRASRRKRGSGAGQWGLASAGKGAQGCGGVAHCQRQGGRPAGEETGEGKERGRGC
jgi:hypothetical protein